MCWSCWLTMCSLFNNKVYITCTGSISNVLKWLTRKRPRWSYFKNSSIQNHYFYRFIPSRSSQDIDLSHFAIMKEKGENEENDPDWSPSKAPYQNQLNTVLNKGDNPQDTKILSFNNKCPAATGTSVEKQSPTEWIEKSWINHDFQSETDYIYIFVLINQGACMLILKINCRSQQQNESIVLLQ